MPTDRTRRIVEEPERDETDEAPTEIATGDESSVEELSIPIDAGVAVLGRRGSGKTEVVKYLARELPYDLGILDVVGNLKELKDLGPALKWRGIYTAPRFVDYHLVNPRDVDGIGAILENYMDKQRILALMDEADRYPYFANVKSTITDFINLARNYQCGYIATARRTANISTDFLSNATYLFVFRHTHPNDLGVLEEWLEVDVGVIRHLEDHEFIVFKDGMPLFRAKLDL
jgi:hypothetical protein